MKSRNGVTLLELMICLGVLALLFALLFPAISAAKNSQNRIQCMNQLKQLGIAHENYLSTWSRYPAYGDSPGETYFRLASFLEQPEQPRGTDLAIYVCPSDNLNNPSFERANLVWNRGSGVACKLAGPLAPFCDFTPVLPKHITDGLSNTALMSERLLAYPHSLVPPQVPKNDEATAVRNPLRFLWYVDRRYDVLADHDEFRNACQTQRTSTNPHPHRSTDPNGFGWADWAFYDHSLPPNSIGCYPIRAPLTTDDFLNADMSATRPASSLHTGGVNTLFCDQSVRFVSSQIDHDAWSACGTRAAGEALTIDF